MIEAEWLPIHYGGFYDVPEAFLTEYKGELFLFRRYFDEDLDDYVPNYEVYAVQNTAFNEAFERYKAPTQAVKFHDFALLLKNPLIGKVPVKEVEFDPTNRRFVNSRIFKNL